MTLISTPENTKIACCQRWVDEAVALGGKLRLATVTGLLRRGGHVVGVELDGETIEADAGDEIVFTNDQ